MAVSKQAEAPTQSVQAQNSLVKPVIVLVLICAVSSALLGFAHYITAPIAAATAQEKAQETYAALMPEAASFEEVTCTQEDCTQALLARDASGETSGYIIVAQSKGYGGEVPLAVAFGLDGTVINIVAMQNSETPGLGSRISEESFIGQFVGRDASGVDVAQIDTISGATISSKAALAAFNAACSAYQEVSA
ncbi:MAG: FMN-binding protein [Atopobiaceae bacterium]|jgi:electron transport complex protein RnfG